MIKHNFMFGNRAIPHLSERLILISWQNNRDCHKTMLLSLKTMEVQIDRDQWKKRFRTVQVYYEIRLQKLLLGDQCNLCRSVITIEDYLNILCCEITMTYSELWMNTGFVKYYTPWYFTRIFSPSLLNTSMTSCRLARRLGSFLTEPGPVAVYINSTFPAWCDNDDRGLGT